MGGNPVQALHLALADPPYQTRTDAVKVRDRVPRSSLLHRARRGASRDASCAPCGSPVERARGTPSAQDASFDVVYKVLHAIKDADIEGAVGALSLEECDVLMKYLYRGLGPAGKKNETYTALLKWHPVVLKRAGNASIMRAISEVNQA